MHDALGGGEHNSMAKIPGRCIYSLGDGVNALTMAVPRQRVLGEEGGTLSKAAHEPHAPEEGAIPYPTDTTEATLIGEGGEAYHLLTISGQTSPGGGENTRGGHSGNSAITTSWWEWLGGSVALSYKIDLTYCGGKARCPRLCGPLSN